VVVAGAGNPHYDELQAAAAESPQPIRTERNVTDMPGLMSWADLAVSAGGSTCWELAFMGLPNVVLVLADNQRGIAAGLGEAGVSLNLGWHADCTAKIVADALEGLMFSADRRAKMSRRGRELVDGLGGTRVVAELAGV
jgi:spore coat polysaccharide biosynthesis predicted glycosyltransferase SpsG